MKECDIQLGLKVRIITDADPSYRGVIGVVSSFGQKMYVRPDVYERMFAITVPSGEHRGNVIGWYLAKEIEPANG